MRCARMNTFGFVVQFSSIVFDFCFLCNNFQNTDTSEEKKKQCNYCKYFIKCPSEALQPLVIRGHTVEIDRVNYQWMFTQQNICPVQYPTLMLLKPESGNVQWKQDVVLFVCQHKQQLQHSVREVIRNTTAYQ